MATVQTTSSPISSALQSSGSPSAFTAHIRAADRQAGRQTDPGASAGSGSGSEGGESALSPPGMTEPTSCSVRTDSFSSESIRITPWLRSCMDNTPRPGGVLPSSTGLGGGQEEPIRAQSRRGGGGADSTVTKTTSETKRPSLTTELDF